MENKITVLNCGHIGTGSSYRDFMLWDWTSLRVCKACYTSLVGAIVIGEFGHNTNFASVDIEEEKERMKKDIEDSVIRAIVKSQIR